MDQNSLKRYFASEPDAKLRDAVTELLYDDIVSLRIRPGSKLNVNQIASTLGISRTPVAEAIAKLSEVGFVVSRPGQSGNYVLELSLCDMINLYKVRTAIECEAAALCAYNADDAQVHQLTALADAFKDSVIRKDVRGMKDTDMPFHKLLISACGNPYLEQSYSVLMPKLTMYQCSMMEFVGHSTDNDNPWASSIKFNHVSVASAIRLRMPELARQSMADHISVSLNFTTLTGNGSDPFMNISGK